VTLSVIVSKLFHQELEIKHFQIWKLKAIWPHFCVFCDVLLKLCCAKNSQIYFLVLQCACEIKLVLKIATDYAKDFGVETCLDGVTFTCFCKTL